MADANKRPYSRTETPPLIDAIEAAKKGFKTDLGEMMASAKVCEAASLWQEGADIMVEVFRTRINKMEEPSQEERDMLSNHFKNLVGSLRAAWRTIDDGDDSDAKAAMLEWIKNDMIAKSNRLINLVEQNMFKPEDLTKPGMTAKDFGKFLSEMVCPEDNTNKKDWIRGKVFYLKMCGDYYRYIAELTKKDERSQSDKDKAEEMYKAAMKAAKAQLGETDPTRLGLALNWSVCCFELLNNAKEAKTIAKNAFDNAIQKLDTLNDNSYKDSTLIMQLLRDNLTIWTGDEQREDDEQAD